MRNLGKPTKQNIVDAASSLSPAKFLIWAQDMELNPVIANYDDVFDVNRDTVIIEVEGLQIKYENGVKK